MAPYYQHETSDIVSPLVIGITLSAVTIVAFMITTIICACCCSKEDEKHQPTVVAVTAPGDQNKSGDQNAHVGKQSQTVTVSVSGAPSEPTKSSGLSPPPEIYDIPGDFNASVSSTWRVDQGQFPSFDLTSQKEMTDYACASPRFKSPATCIDTTNLPSFQLTSKFGPTDKLSGDSSNSTARNVSRQKRDQQKKK